MVNAKELVQAGKLTEAIRLATAHVRNRPADLRTRTTLFELLCFGGEWDRAEKQLDVIEEQQDKTAPEAARGVDLYRDNIKAERLRLGLFAEGIRPQFLSEPPPYVALLLTAIDLVAAVKLKEAQSVLREVEDARPQLSGQVSGQNFEDFRDYNDLVAPVLEAFIAGRYVWLPLEHIKRLTVEPPKRLRDLMWSTAKIESTTGMAGEVVLPALYAGSFDHPDDRVRLGQVTDWKGIGSGLFMPAGLRMFLVDGDERAFLTVASLEFDCQDASEVLAV